MEDQKDKKACSCGSCSCGTGMGWCGCGHHYGWIILRIVIAILIVIAAFGIGMKLGELKQAYVDFGGGYGGYGGRMMRYPMMGDYYGYGAAPHMMQYPSAAAGTGGSTGTSAPTTK